MLFSGDCLECAAQVIDRSSTAHERHDFGDAGRMLYDFCWGEFADWYIEAAKARLYGQDPQAALQTRQVPHLPFCKAPPPGVSYLFIFTMHLETATLAVFVKHVDLLTCRLIL